MATRIRLQRHGHKNYAFYTIVIADAQAPRDGKFIERIGTYNPNTNPATVELKFDRALYWVNVGAQPTDTVRSIMSHEGVYLMKHLLTGVKKGAFDEAEAQKRFEAWKKDKQNGLKAIADKAAADKKAADAARLAAELRLLKKLLKLLRKLLLRQQKKLLLRFLLKLLLQNKVRVHLNDSENTSPMLLSGRFFY